MTRNLLRFKDLHERGIVSNWPQLKNMVENYGFPAGRMVGANSRAWFEDEIYSWLEGLPSALDAKPPLRGSARKRVEALKAREAAATDGGTS